MSVLVVEDDPTMREMLVFNIEKAGFKVISSENGSGAINEALEKKPKVVVLDLMLPGICGMTVCQTIKENISQVSVIMLTALCDKATEDKAKSNGADCFLGKPFSMLELLSLIKNFYQKAGAENTLNASSKKIAYGDMVIDPPTLKVSVNNADIKLSAKEYQLLYFMIKNKEVLLTREVIYKQVWGYDFLGVSKTIDVYINALRKKVESKSANKFIRTVRGFGYIFELGERERNNVQY